MYIVRSVGRNIKLKTDRYKQTHTLTHSHTYILLFFVVLTSEPIQAQCQDPMQHPHEHSWQPMQYSKTDPNIK